jgi:hypothetical protein
MNLEINFILVSHGRQLGLSRLRRNSSDWSLTLTKRVTQKSLGAKIVRHLLQPGMEVLTDKEGDVCSNVFGGHDGGVLCLPMVHLISTHERKTSHRKKKRDFTDEHSDTMPCC